MKAGQTVYSEAVRARTAELAQEAGDKAWEQARPALEGLKVEGLSDIFDASLMEQVEARIRAREIEELTAKRERGWNDHSSHEPGIVLFLSRNGLAKLRDEVRRGFKSQEHLRAFQPVDADGRLHFIHLPDGGYTQDNGGLDVVEHYPEDLRHNYAHGAAIFRGGEADIVRIEGSGGELVQNMHFQQDGTPNFDGARPPGFGFTF